MQSQPQTVLSYASPVKAETGEVATELELQFERQPVWREAAMCGVSLLLASAGIAINFLMLFALYSDRSPDRDRPAITVALGFALAILGVIAWVTLRGLLRLRRFGHTPVLILLDGPNITVSDPLRFGATVRVLPLAGLRRCTAEMVSLPLSSLRVYQLVLRPRGWPRRSTKVHVAVRESGIVERAAADLQRAIDRANGKD